MVEKKKCKPEPKSSERSRLIRIYLNAGSNQSDEEFVG